jgi:hypothetical protein
MEDADTAAKKGGNGAPATLLVGAWRAHTQHSSFVESEQEGKREGETRREASKASPRRPQWCGTHTKSKKSGVKEEEEMTTLEEEAGKRGNSERRMEDGSRERRQEKGCG